MPKSKWTKTAILANVRAYCDEFDMTYDARAEKLTKDELFHDFIEWSSWHHTGKFANETDFYGLNEDAVVKAFDDFDAYMADIEDLRRFKGGKK